MNTRLLIIILFTTILGACGVSKVASDSQPITHEDWTVLLQKHVDIHGNVDYKGFVEDSVALNKYLQKISSHHPNDKNWSSNERKAYWINAYNAFTVQLIVRNYPTESIKDLGGVIYKVNTPWDIRFIEIERHDYDLNNIEHDILRERWQDARIHCAVNCASISCPELLNEAFEAETLEDQLTQVTRDFLSDEKRNNLDANPPRISRIFKWFGSDFKTSEGSLWEFINKYSDQTFTDSTQFQFLEYNWRLNDQY